MTISLYSCDCKLFISLFVSFSECYEYPKQISNVILCQFYCLMFISVFIFVCMFVCLFVCLIRKQEMSHRKSLMNNPIRMKQLQQMVSFSIMFNHIPLSRSVHEHNFLLKVIWSTCKILNKNRQKLL